MSSAADLYPAPGAAPANSQVSADPAQAPAANPQIPALTLSNGVNGNPIGSSGTGVATASKLAAFEGFLKKAGLIAGVVLTEIVRYVIPVASVVTIADPEAAPAVEAFVASVKLVQNAVISVQQKWANEGSEANAQKLADVLTIVEQPVILMFEQAGVQVNLAYVTNLVNGVVAILNAQPGVMLRLAA